MRGIGVPGALGELVGPVVVLFALVTQLGDLWFLTLAVTIPYWLDEHTPWIGDALDRERTATLVALLLGTVALLVTLKPAFGLSRPPGAGVPPSPDLVPAVLDGLYAWLSTGDGYGFPSGHALGSTVVFGGLAWTIRAGDRRHRVVVAAALVALVSLSRLVLGLHYLADVLAGAAIGLVYVAVVIRVLGTPRRAFAAAAAVALAGTVVVGPGDHLFAVTGLCAGGLAIWLAVGERLLTASPSPRGATLTAGLGLVVVAPLLAVVTALETAWPLALLVGLVAGGLLVGAPLIGDGLGKKESVVRRR